MKAACELALTCLAMVRSQAGAFEGRVYFVREEAAGFQGVCRCSGFPIFWHASCAISMQLVPTNERRKPWWRLAAAACKPARKTVWRQRDAPPGGNFPFHPDRSRVSMITLLLKGETARASSRQSDACRLVVVIGALIANYLLHGGAANTTPSL